MTFHPQSSTDLDPPTVAEPTPASPIQNEKLRRIIARESRMVPWEPVAILCLIWLGYFVLTYLLFKAHDAVEPCSAGWIVLLLAGATGGLKITITKPYHTKLSHHGFAPQASRTWSLSISVCREH